MKHLNGGEHFVLSELKKHGSTETQELNTYPWSTYNKQHFIESLVELGFIEAKNENYTMTKNGKRELKLSKNYMHSTCMDKE